MFVFSILSFLPTVVHHHHHQYHLQHYQKSLLKVSLCLHCVKYYPSWTNVSYVKQDRCRAEGQIQVKAKNWNPKSSETSWPNVGILSWKVTELMGNFFFHFSWNLAWLGPGVLWCHPQWNICMEAVLRSRDLFLKYFIIYAITVVPFFPFTSFHPAHFWLP